MKVLRTRLFFALLAVAAALPVPAGAAPPADTDLSLRMATCVACHGREGAASSAAYFPRLAGKPAGYLFNQLVSFRDGRRFNADMAHLVRHLSDDYLREMAEYFSGLHPPYPSPQPLQAPAAVLARGKQLALEGDKRLNLPACIACHGDALTGV
ncbi:MAG: cytochrome c4, partial [Comamonadaceae bacterium]